MRVIYYHVGKGDISLVLSPNGEAIMIDCYKAAQVVESSDYEYLKLFEQIKDNILEHRKSIHSMREIVYLEENNQKKVPIRILAVTHADSDHISASDDLNKFFDIECLIDNGRNYSDPSDKTKDYIQYRSKMKSAGRYKAFTRAAYNIYPKSMLNIDILCPNRDIDADEDNNNQCLVLKVSYNNISFLFTGDTQIDDWVNDEYGILNIHSDKVPSDFLNVSHHGSRTFFTPPGPRLDGKKEYDKSEYDTRALNIIRPIHSFITCSDKEDAEHPDKYALEIYQEITNDGIGYNKSSHVVLSRNSKHLYHVIDDDGNIYMRTSRSCSSYDNTGKPNYDPQLVGTVNSKNGYLTESGIWVSKHNNPDEDDNIYFEVYCKGKWSGAIEYDWWVLNNGMDSHRLHREFYTLDSADNQRKSKWSRPLVYEGVHIMQCYASNHDNTSWASWCVLVCRESSLRYAQRWLQVFPGCIDSSKINKSW